ncbi:hypothetical protein U5801_28420 [Lamprobacter modestohalophilus]|uniref:hypothetical protein n=1 Tax=Lamprobacter modestohalophilus TaxID=1064514 RepID=UPI002ADEA747|nr:hypothetical protein [Lamprobacter modestohalophilus]MEA1052753.1 hypothetical protein [Lamprobacter modestohalophilus]MEA1053703.1 hypothetical protein [Lamprobacter modestohalophilus]
MTIDETRLARLADLFETAEQRLKEAETLNQELSIPALNELRYVAYHLVRALRAEEPDAADWQRAENHARRAIYDATEATLLTLLDQAYSHRERFRACEDVLDVLPEYPRQLITLHEVQQRLLSARASEALTWSAGVMTTAARKSCRYCERCWPNSPQPNRACRHARGCVPPAGGHSS